MTKKGGGEGRGLCARLEMYEVVEMQGGEKVVEGGSGSKGAGGESRARE